MVFCLRTPWGEIVSLGGGICTQQDQAHERYEKALEELSVIRSELETSEDYSSGKTSSLRKQVYTLEGELSLVRVENEKLQAQVRLLPESLGSAHQR